MSYWHYKSIQEDEDSVRHLSPLSEHLSLGMTACRWRYQMSWSFLSPGDAGFLRWQGGVVVIFARLDSGYEVENWRRASSRSRPVYLNHRKRSLLFCRGRKICMNKKYDRSCIKFWTRVCFDTDGASVCFQTFKLVMLRYVKFQGIHRLYCSLVLVTSFPSSRIRGKCMFLFSIQFLIRRPLYINETITMSHYWFMLSDFLICPLICTIQYKIYRVVFLIQRWSLSRTEWGLILSCFTFTCGSLSVRAASTVVVPGDVT